MKSFVLHKTDDCQSEAGLKKRKKASKLAEPSALNAAEPEREKTFSKVSITSARENLKKKERGSSETFVGGMSKNLAKGSSQSFAGENIDVTQQTLSRVLLVGNPNSGKTTMFNSLTRSNEHVGNWHGVTVENKEKTFEVDGKKFALVDTPGLYSLCPLSFEEKVAAETILSGKDKIINLCDQNNLERNLYLTLCLLELGLDVVVAVNEIDKKPIYKIDYKKLSKMLGVQVFAVNAQKKQGLEKLKKSLLLQKENYLPPEYVKKLKNDKKLAKNVKKTPKKSSFLEKTDIFYVIKAYEHDENYLENVDKLPEGSIEEIAKLRYEYIEKTLKICTTRTGKTYGKSKLDKVILNKFLAFPIFVGIMALIFYLTFFSVGAFFSQILGDFLSFLANPLLSLIENSFGQGALYDFFNVAIFGGLSTVLAFLPQVALLFFFLSVLEDSGYMSRVAFVFEDILSRIGLSGKGIYTLLMGFGCSTTAIMTSRNMEDKNAKIKTALLCPYMSCSAKIPIYTVVGGAFFGAKNLLVIIFLYFLGVAVAISISKILDMTILKSENQSFILEFPPYRMISLSRVGKILWKNVKDFVVRVGSVMVAVNIVVWVLSNFSFKLSYVGGSNGVSILETFGKFLAPLFVPLGFGNWAVVSALIAGLVAKEVVVSSIAMFNGIDASATRLVGQSLLLSTSLVYFSSTASVISFLVFCLLYTPCLASISMLLHEVGKKWTIFGVFLQIFSAYVVSFVIYNFALAIEIFGFFEAFCVFFAIFLVIFSIFLIFRKFKKKNYCTYCNSRENCKRKNKS